MELSDTLEASGNDLEVLEKAVDHASSYIEEYGQGPVWLTGSALYDSEPGDYDLVVQRSFEEVPDKADYCVAAEILDELTGEEIDRSEQDAPLESQLEASDRVDTGSNVNLYPEPVRRFRIKLEGIEIDLSFNSERPVDEALKLFQIE